MSCARHPLPWPGSLEPASPGLAACRSSPPFGPWNFAAFGSTPWDERRARPLGHGGAREDAPRGTLASADAARLPPDTRQGVQQPRLLTLGCSVHQHARTGFCRGERSPVNCARNTHTRSPLPASPFHECHPAAGPHRLSTSLPHTWVDLSHSLRALTYPGRISKGTRPHPHTSLTPPQNHTPPPITDEPTGMEGKRPFAGGICCRDRSHGDPHQRDRARRPCL